MLEVGCGHGFVTRELVRRAGGTVTAVDLDADAVFAARAHAKGPDLLLAAADARKLPFADGSFDLVFFQNTLMWIDPAEDALKEAARVLQTGGALVALEPDYGGMIEEPDLGLRNIWLDALERAGADPVIGRRLPQLAEDVGLDPWVEFAHIPRAAESDELALLEELPLTMGQRRLLEGARGIIAGAQGSWSVFLHVPYVLLVTPGA
ncbi:MAG: class I SAM-dependent methyltransferase [candidate division WS1 bacterium]|nr:class I SAM-dependent methyltransferase [candidate division WS1 bacterium]